VSLNSYVNNGVASYRTLAAAKPDFKMLRKIEDSAFLEILLAQVHHVKLSYAYLSFFPHFCSFQSRLLEMMWPYGAPSEFGDDQTASQER